MTMTAPAEDHRTRTAERRRDAMRARLVESAMLTFAEKGVDAAIIDDVIKAAGVSRGTFYKYFDSTQALMIEVSAELGNELLAIVESQVMSIRRPDERIAVGLRLFMETARAFPLFAAFTRKVGLDALGPATLINLFLPPHLEDGVAAGLFLDAPLSVHLDLITGGVLLCVVRMTTENVDGRHIEQVVASIMRGLGMSANDAQRVAGIDAGALLLPQESLLVRANRRLPAAD